MTSAVKKMGHKSGHLALPEYEDNLRHLRFLAFLSLERHI